MTGAGKDEYKQRKPVIFIKLKISFPLRQGVDGINCMADGNLMEFTEGATIQEVLKMLNLSERGTLIFLINGHQAIRQSTLHDGDVLHIYPMMTGG